MAQVRKLESGGISAPKKKLLFNYQGVGDYDAEDLLSKGTLGLDDYLKNSGWSEDRQANFRNYYNSFSNAVREGKVSKNQDGTYTILGNTEMNSNGVTDKRLLGGRKNTSNNYFNDVGSYFNNILGSASIIGQDPTKQKSKFQSDSFSNIIRNNYFNGKDYTKDDIYAYETKGADGKYTNSGRSKIAVDALTKYMNTALASEDYDWNETDKTTYQTNMQNLIKNIQDGKFDQLDLQSGHSLGFMAKDLNEFFLDSIPETTQIPETSQRTYTGLDGNPVDQNNLGQEDKTFKVGNGWTRRISDGVKTIYDENGNAVENGWLQYNKFDPNNQWKRFNYAYNGELLTPKNYQQSPYAKEYIAAYNSLRNQYTPLTGNNPHTVGFKNKGYNYSTDLSQGFGFEDGRSLRAYYRDIYNQDDALYEYTDVDGKKYMTDKMPSYNQLDGNVYMNVFDQSFDLGKFNGNEISSTFTDWTDHKPANLQNLFNEFSNVDFNNTQSGSYQTMINSLRAMSAKNLLKPSARVTGWSEFASPDGEGTILFNPANNQVKYLNKAQSSADISISTPRATQSLAEEAIANSNSNYSREAYYKKKGGRLEILFSQTGSKITKGSSVAKKAGSTLPKDIQDSYFQQTDKAQIQGIGSGQSDIEKQGGYLSEADNWRLYGAMADAASMGFSLIPGLHVVGAAAGLGGTATNFVADIKEDGVNWGDFGNLAGNLALDGLSLLPGGKAAKAGKAMKTITKFLPIITGAVQTGRLISDPEISQSVLGTLGKLTNGDLGKLDTQDFQNLQTIGSILVSGKLVAKNTNKAFFRGQAKTGKQMISGTTKDGKEITAEIGEGFIKGSKKDQIAAAKEHLAKTNKLNVEDVSLNTSFKTSKMGQVPTLEPVKGEIGTGANWAQRGFNKLFPNVTNPIRADKAFINNAGSVGRAYGNLFNSMPNKIKPTTANSMPNNATGIKLLPPHNYTTIDGIKSYGNGINQRIGPPKNPKKIKPMTLSTKAFPISKATQLRLPFKKEGGTLFLQDGKIIPGIGSNKKKIRFGVNPSDVIGLGQMALGLYTNEKVAKTYKDGLKPTMLDYTDKNFMVTGDPMAKMAANKQANSIINSVERPRTSDASLYEATRLDAENKASNIRLQGDIQDANRFYQNSMTGMDINNKNIEGRTAVANQNRTNMNQISAAKAQIDSMKHSTNYGQVLAPWMMEQRSKFAQNDAYNKQLELQNSAQNLQNSYNVTINDLNREGESLRVNWDKNNPDNPNGFLTSPEYINWQNKMVAARNKFNTDTFNARKSMGVSTPLVSFNKKGSKLNYEEQAALEDSKEFNKKMRLSIEEFNKNVRESKKLHASMIDNVSKVTAELIIKGMS